jgi:hypothetical protein
MGHLWLSSQWLEGQLARRFCGELARASHDHRERCSELEGYGLSKVMSVPVQEHLSGEQVYRRMSIKGCCPCGHSSP